MQAMQDEWHWNNPIDESIKKILLMGSGTMEWMRSKWTVANKGQIALMD